MFWSTLFALSALSAPTQLGTFEVVDVARTAAWAGKLGHRVTETITVKSERGTFTMELMRYHTRVAGKPRTYSKGDLLSITGIVEGTHISADPTSVRPVRL